MIDPLFLGPRVERYGVLLHKGGGGFSQLDGVTAGRIEMNVDRSIMGGGTLTIRDTGTTIDWMTDRLQPWVEVNGKSWPLAMWLPGSPKTKWDEFGRSWEVTCLDRTSVLDEWKIDQTYSLDEGTVVTDAVLSLIQQTGETGWSLTNSTKETRDLLVWNPGTSILRICNDLLQHIDYQRLWCEGSGNFRIEPNLPPHQRPVIAKFIEGETAIHSPVLTRDQDILGVPNKVVLTTSSTDNSPALVSTATNTDPNNPYSYQARGNRWVVRTYENVEAADQATLDSRASQYLWTASTPVANWSVSHAVVPLNVFERVQLTHGDERITAWVNEWTVTLATGALMTGLWTEVTR